MLWMCSILTYPPILPKIGRIEYGSDFPSFQGSECNRFYYCLIHISFLNQDPCIPITFDEYLYLGQEMTVVFRNQR